MRNKSMVLLAGLLCCAGASAGAAESTAERLTRIEADTLLLKAREKQLDVQLSIAARQNEIAAKRQLNEQLTQNAAQGDPVIRSIEGIGRAMFVTLQLSNGTLLDAQAGDVLSNGMKVLSIRSNEVIVQGGKQRRIRLAAQGSVPSGFPSGYAGVAGALPPPLPMAAPRGGAQ